MHYGVIIHGGAWNIPDELVQAHLKGVVEACEVANAILKQPSGNALDAAEDAISIMEDNPTFDAGRGSFVNQIGEVEMDAIIATDNYKIGSVCAIQNVANPIKVARLVMNKTDHIMLAGNGAYLFAKEMGIREVSPEDLLIGRELERYHEIKKQKRYNSKDAFRKLSKPYHMGTVGCVCLDQKGRISVAVSTGGTPYKKAGRVGDTPLWGSGAYLESSLGGAAATGYGEDLIRILATKTCIQYLHSNLSIQDAINHTIKELKEKVDGFGGIIGLTPHSIGLAFNTPRMAFAYQIEDNEIISGIDPQNLSQFLSK